MKYVSFADKEFEGDWRVEAIDSNGVALITIFSGPDAEMRALAYADWKNGVAAVGRTLQVETQDGHKVVLYLDGLKWSQDVRRNTITARPKDMIEIVSETLGGGNVTP